MNYVDCFRRIRFMMLRQLAEGRFGRIALVIVALDFRYRRTNNAAHCHRAMYHVCGVPKTLPTRSSASYPEVLLPIVAAANKGLVEAERRCEFGRYKDEWMVVKDFPDRAPEKTHLWHSTKLRRCLA